MVAVPQVRAVLLSLFVASCLTGAASAFEIPFHMNITNDAINSVSETIGTRTVGFSDRAKQQIRESNAATDNTSSAAAFFPERHFTSERFAASSQRLIDLKEEIINLVTQSEPDGATARQRLGTALHTLQDFYAHSNWVELGNGGINNALGRSAMADPPATLHTCPTDGSVLGAGGGGGLTSGYTGLLTINCVSLPTGKCSHGNYPDEHPLLPNCPGINKDRPLAGPNHFTAAALATQASNDYLEQILSEIRGNDEAVAALLDARGSLIFVVDDTGSMGEEIDGVKSIIANIVTFVAADEDLRPDNYILVRFGDPDVGSAFTTTDPSALLSAVSGLFPHGGDDCPELSQFGMLNALFAAYPFSDLFLFTDASAKDADVASTVISVAEDKNTTLNYALTGSCSPIDPVYLRGAHETGGQLFFVNQFEIPLLTDLFRPQLGGDFVRVLSRRGTLAGGSRTDMLPVDDSMRSLVVSVSYGTAMTLEITAPDGSVITPTTPGVHRTTLSTAVIWSIDAPAVGNWTLRLTGSGEFDLAASGNSDLSFEHFAFGALSEEMHGGFVRTGGQPLSGENSLAEAILLGPATSANFSLLADDESPIQTPALARGVPKMDPLAFVGPVVLPAVPFHVLAEGLTAGGQPFRREFLRRFVPQQLQIVVEGDQDRNVSAGQLVQLPFVVRNLSNGSVTLNFRASDALAYGSSADPAQATIAGHDSVVVTVSVTVPTNAVEGAEDGVTLVASSPFDPSITNSAQVRLHVGGANNPPDCSGLAAQQIQMWPPNHQMIAFDLVSLGGATDPDGDALTYEVLGITQDEPVMGPGDRTSPDARIIGGGQFELRSERQGSGDGRVYAVLFRVSDGRGGSCTCTLHVEVPHDQGAHAVPQPVTFESTTQDEQPAAAPVAVAWSLTSQPSPSRRSGTTIQLAMAAGDASGIGELTIHDIAGRTLRSWPVEYVGRATRSFVWDGRASNGRPVDAGMYFIRFRLAERTLTRTHIVLQ